MSDPEAGYGSIEPEAKTEPRPSRRRLVLAAAVAAMVVFAAPVGTIGVQTGAAALDVAGKEEATGYETPRPRPWPSWKMAIGGFGDAGKQLEEQVTPSLSLSPCAIKKHRAVTDQIDESSIPGHPKTEADCAGNDGDDVDYDDIPYNYADNDPVTDDADNDDAHDDGQIW
mmetsp:Transcript_2541/g.7452  ORF Transcript_2541/g.7452 Transcript_2541/m.7452 type:complete len:170 (+) Transcript_2541:266-775(+)|eukprot:CAMPEP_0119271348 /NCGR_PEP_ID=MMETSP1329-20130426/7977_1 /TAXON_ID=114041 /ORGANISM="Genus nov. species nov., Strain RCC1024" /LENGTH=169 /DNA_ID=CAMNT_0007271395 /DNA_START=210 /DNA_END=719 /DNA_ORIENTATION=-